MEAKNEKFKQNYCKFVIQFNSIPKIISLIALLFILLFSISCKSYEEPKPEPFNEKPSNEDLTEKQPKYLELVGSWKNDNYNNIYTFTINNNGDIKLERNGFSHTYSGKIANNFDYPYTTEIVTTIGSTTRIGTITFNSASSCTGSSLWYRGWGSWTEYSFIFTNASI